jgi:hypothetical protein
MTDFDDTVHFAEPTDDPPVEAEEVVSDEVELTEPEPEVAPEPEEKPKRRRASKQEKSPTGTYVLQRGDNPSTVARQLFGRASRGREIVAANPGVKWREGVEVVLPQDDS